MSWEFWDDKMEEAVMRYDDLYKMEEAVMRYNYKKKLETDFESRHPPRIADVKSIRKEWAKRDWAFGLTTNANVQNVLDTVEAEIAVLLKDFK